MSVRDDAIFLAGFITGTYELKGESLPPACIQKVIERVVAAETAPSETRPRLFPVTTDESLPAGVVEFRDGDTTVLRIESRSESDQEHEARPGDPQKTDGLTSEKKERKKPELTPEESERRSHRMKQMWERKRAERGSVSSISAVTSVIVRAAGGDEPGNAQAPSAGGA